MIPIRTRSDAPITTFGVRAPLAPEHPLADTPCPVCDGSLAEAPITLVLVGIDPETRAEGKTWCTGAAVVVHAACAGVQPDAPESAAATAAEAGLTPAETYLRPFLGLSDRLPDGSPQEAPVRIDALRSLMLEQGLLRAGLETARERAESIQVCLTQAEDYARAYIDAFEQLHLRVVGACDLDAAEAPPPAERFWADQIEQLLHAAHETYESIDPMRNASTEPAPHLVTVTRLDPGFDHSDTQPFEYVIGNDVAGWVSHLVTHSAACHLLPYGTPCWFDDEWENGRFCYDDVGPGSYSVLPGRRNVDEDEGANQRSEACLDYRPLTSSPTREG